MLNHTVMIVYIDYISQFRMVAYCSMAIIYNTIQMCIFHEAACIGFVSCIENKHWHYHIRDSVDTHESLF